MQRWVLSKHATTVVAERAIRLVWIEFALSSPDAIVRDQVDPCLRHALRSITEADNRLLRVVYNAVESPIVVVTVFFDRRERRRREGHLR